MRFHHALDIARLALQSAGAVACLTRGDKNANTDPCATEIAVHVRESSNDSDAGQVAEGGGAPTLTERSDHSFPDLRFTLPEIRIRIF